MANIPVRLSELRTDEGSSSRNSRRSKIPVNDGNRKRSMSTEPKSCTKIKAVPVLPVPQQSAFPLRRSRSALSLCSTPCRTPVRHPSQSRPPSTIRPNQEKALKISEQTTALQKYLVDNELPMPNGGLRQMTISHFVNYLQHFTSLLTANRIKITPTNYIDEMMKMMKLFKYNGQLSKSILLAPMTRHSWPHALALLTWFRLICEELFEANTCYLPNDQQNQQMLCKMDYIYKMYELFNEGNDSEVEILVDKCVTELSCPSLLENLNDMEAQLVQKRAQIHNFRAILDEKRQQYEDLRKGRESFMQQHQHLIELEEKRQILSDKLAKLKLQKDKILEKNNTLLEEKKTLQAQVRDQPMNKHQKSIIKSQVVANIEKLNNNKELRQKHTEHNYEYDLKLLQLDSELNKVLVTYKSFMCKLYEHLTLLNLDFNKESLQITLEVTDDLTKLKQTLLEKISILQTCSEALQEELSKSDDSYKDHLNKKQQRKDFIENMKQETRTLLLEDQSVMQNINALEENISEIYQRLELKQKELESTSKEVENRYYKLNAQKILLNELTVKMNESKMQLIELKENCMKIRKEKLDFVKKERQRNMDAITALHEAISGMNNKLISFWKKFSEDQNSS
ncbi:probable kinetochore protein NDC80 [Ctenocephalides felis]|uniref:probable kinetochore protein NDC80 n=1 Tax=Ctenocephalides felis TaxID=7515 RepID=UPI000E6E4DAB|nr:probable kinetochore protein NDC80 [Ctenocephalides felis]